MNEDLKLFNDSDLEDVFKELEADETDKNDNNDVNNKEMDAAQRRYLEIIKKHKE